MSILKANRMVDSLIKRSTGKNLEKYQLLLKFINDSIFWDLTDQALSKEIGLKVKFIKNIREIIKADDDQKSDFVLYQTKYGSYSLMKVKNIRNNSIRNKFSLQTCDSENFNEIKQFANLFALVKFWKNRAEIAERKAL